MVELLLGEIPDRLQFRQPSLKRSLMPYFLLTQGQCHTHTPDHVTNRRVMAKRWVLIGGTMFANTVVYLPSDTRSFP